MPKLWFRARNFGWGWTPITWEGWLVLAISLVLIFAGTEEFAYWAKAGGDRRLGLPLLLLWIALVAGGLIFLCYAKGERPRWRWGADREQK